MLKNRGLFIAIFIIEVILFVQLASVGDRQLWEVEKGYFNKLNSSLGDILWEMDVQTARDVLEFCAFIQKYKKIQLFYFTLQGGELFLDEEIKLSRLDEFFIGVGLLQPRTIEGPIQNEGRSIGFLRVDWYSPVSYIYIFLTIIFIITNLIMGFIYLFKRKKLELETRIKENHKKLASHELRFQLLVNSMSEGLVVSDENNKISFVNTQLAFKLGYRQDEMIGCDFSSFFDGNNLKILKTQQAIRRLGESDLFEIEWLKKDKTPFKTLISPQPIFDNSGKFRGGVAVVSDMNKKMFHESSLAECDSRACPLFDQMDLGVVISKVLFNDVGEFSDLTIVHVNPVFEKSFGLLKGDLTGNRFSEVLSGNWDIGEELSGIFKDSFSEGNRQAEAFFLRDKKWFSLTFYSAGKDYYVILFNDITLMKHKASERAKNFKMLQVKNRELENIIYAASHDLRSPLVNIEGFTGELNFDIDNLKQLITGIEMTSEKRSEIKTLLDNSIPGSLEYISSSAWKMDKLLKGILRVCRLGRENIVIRRVDVNAILKEIRLAIQFQLSSQKIELTVLDLPDCFADPFQLNQVFSNLIDNAIKYCDPRKENHFVKVTGNISNEYSLYVIEDNGLGVPENEKEKIFSIFNRLNKKDIDGEGVGLTIVKRIVERFNGKVWVESTEGEGAKFFVMIPAFEGK